ncbi:MAG: DUF4926 domain-containing protein [Afipia sp.]
MRQERFGASLKHGWRSSRDPAEGLERGQVGTIVEQLDDRALLVKFGDDEGRAYAIAPCPQAELLVQRYVPEPACRLPTRRTT